MLYIVLKVPGLFVGTNDTIRSYRNYFGSSITKTTNDNSITFVRQTNEKKTAKGPGDTAPNSTRAEASHDTILITHRTAGPKSSDAEFRDASYTGSYTLIYDGKRKIAKMARGLCGLCVSVFASNVAIVVGGRGYFLYQNVHVSVR